MGQRTGRHGKRAGRKEQGGMKKEQGGGAIVAILKSLDCSNVLN